MPLKKHISGWPICLPDSDLNIGKIQKWLKDCLDSHRRYRNGLSSAILDDRKEGSVLPSRIVAVGLGSSSQVRLVTTNGERGRYCALSYYWGPKSSRDSQITLLTTTIDQFRQAKELPNSIKEAIEVTRRIGVSYLWVDRLCIVQNDAKDVETECDRMCDIYERVLLTWVALDDDTGLKGLFLVWWDQLVTSPLWAQQLSFEHLLEIAKTDRQTTSKLSTQRVSRFCLPIAVVPPQVIQPAIWHTFIPSTLDRQVLDHPLSGASEVEGQLPWRARLPCTIKDNRLGHVYLGRTLYTERGLRDGIKAALMKSSARVDGLLENGFFKRDCYHGELSTLANGNSIGSAKRNSRTKKDLPTPQMIFLITSLLDC